MACQHFFLSILQPSNPLISKSPNPPIRKMDPRDISIDEYDYELPADRIAMHPLEDRDSSKLLIWNKGTISQDIYKNIAFHIPAGSMLVFNNTKVVPARI